MTTRNRDLRYQRKRPGPCPGCGNHKPAGYVYCTSCRIARHGATTQPIAPRFPRRLPVAPLVEVIQRYVDKHLDYNDHGTPMLEECLGTIGVSSRRYYEWVRRRALWIGFDVADRILGELGLDFRDVWDRERHPEFNASLDLIEAGQEVEAA
jgi:hypothetical protein